MRRDCRYFRGDQPCKFHKQDGIECNSCVHYSSMGTRILIIKLDAMGDVLRTTAILPALKQKFPDSFVTWVVKLESLPLLHNIDYIDRKLVYDVETLSLLQVEKFDLLLNFDATRAAGALASLVQAKTKRGFCLDENGMVDSINQEAEEWFQMGISDDRKKANTRTYQEMMLEIAGVAGAPHQIIINLTEWERKFAQCFAEQHGLTNNNLIIGIHPGGGKRWQYKKWTREGYCDLINKFNEELGARVIIIGGKKEEQLNQWIISHAAVPIVDAGCSNTLRQFMALVGLCDLVVCSDTLALHIACGLSKKVVAIFGPTAAAEIDLYGRGEKVVAPLECICCYRAHCDQQPNCMESITVDKVFSAVKGLING